MGKPLTIEYSYIYIFLGLIIIISIIYIYILFNRLPSINSNIDFLNNDLNNLKNDLKGLNSFKDNINNLDLQNTLTKLSNPTGLINAGGDDQIALKPSDVAKMIGIGKYGFIQQHLDIPETVGYCNVLTIVPSGPGYISQIWLSTIYKNPENGTYNIYSRYSTGTVNDVTGTSPTNDTWGGWKKVNS